MSYTNKNMKDLCDMFELNHLIKGPTCFKSSNPTCIDNFALTKIQCFSIRLLLFQFVTMLRSTFCKGPSKSIYCRSYNNYNKEQF